MQVNEMSFNHTCSNLNDGEYINYYYPNEPIFISSFSPETLEYWVGV